MTHRESILVVATVVAAAVAVVAAPDTAAVVESPDIHLAAGIDVGSVVAGG